MANLQSRQHLLESSLQQLVEARAAVGCQLLARAVLSDLAAIEDHDRVGALNSAQAMRNHDRGAALEQPADCARQHWPRRPIGRVGSRSVAGWSRDDASSKITSPGSRRNTRAKASSCASPA